MKFTGKGRMFFIRKILPLYTYRVKMAENRINLQKHAMLFGTYMGVYWIVKFIFLPLGFSNPFFLFLFTGLTLAVPFLGYRYVKMFRDKACNGVISFLQAWLFMVFMYMFAALLTAAAHYIYFRFIDHGFFINKMEEIISTIPTDAPELEKYVSQLNEGMDIVRTLSPIEMTMQLLSQNFLYCSILSLITAPFITRKKKVSSPKL